MLYPNVSVGLGANRAGTLPTCMQKGTASSVLGSSENLPADGKWSEGMVDWYIGFNCLVCGSSIPVMRSDARSTTTIGAQSLNVMCPACGAKRRYDPVDVRHFCCQAS